MQSLREFQRAFASTMLGTLLNDKVQLAAAADKPFSSNRLVNVYANNYSSSLAQALRDIYSTIVTLIGDDCFDHAAGEYLKLHSLRQGNLHEFGKHFPEFLSRFEPVSALKYLCDVAKLDWATHHAYHTGRTNPPAVLALDEIPSEKYGELKFSFCDSATLIDSTHPIFSIWCFTTNNESNNNGVLNLNTTGEHVLVYRQFLDIQIQQLAPAEFAFLKVLQKNQKLSTAVGIAVEHDCNFNLNNTLGHHLNNGVISSVNFA